MEIIKIVAMVLLQIFVSNSNANAEDFIFGEVLKLLEKLTLQVETLEKVLICALLVTRSIRLLLRISRKLLPWKLRMKS